MLIFLVGVVVIDYNQVYNLILSLKLRIIDHLHNKYEENSSKFGFELNFFFLKVNQAKLQLPFF